MIGIRPTPIDARDKKFRVERLFGSVSLPESYLVKGERFPDQMKDNRPSACSAYTIAEICGIEDGSEYSHDYQLMKTFIVMGVPPNTGGADGRTPFKIPCSFGLVPKGKEPTEMGMNTQEWAATPANWDLNFDTESKKNLKPAYLPIGKNPDFFDGIRNALMVGAKERRTVGMATQWSEDFNTEILTNTPTNLFWGHMYQCVGWGPFLGETHLVLKTWEGKKVGYRMMSRELCNKLMKVWGAYAATIKDMPEGTVAELKAQQATFIEVAIALIQNLILKLRYGVY